MTDKDQGAPSHWLLRNSKGYPDFLFTILTYSMLLLVFISLMWIAFAILTFVTGDVDRRQVLIQVTESMKTGLIALAGVVFGLAGSYTVRRVKKDDHWLQRQEMEGKEPEPSAPPVPVGARVVTNEEDI